ncbi:MULTISPECIES: B-4DMT family transporter [unclassified Gordonia (in: high G+C Gram-positive bacteria)]|uniref:B-4DMT family transporter n=1 Tax=unclassified Gordonia (in: high G+C Gram-positive bacteria) TaxID=2657482 RepID=UPI001F0F05A9|nr:B-4DMT family transporter [Gordonia sp. ABSL49_1]MCH5643536.1 B-4DMT family transporter [Gordonia sp. ABSL49_1]
MTSWLPRGLVMAAVHILARVLLGVAVVQAPLHSTVWKTIAVAAVVLVALVWGGIDGIRDARANPDPDDYEDLTVRWLQAGLVAGVLSGPICWLLGTLWFAGIGQSSFFVELIAGGSFTALLVFVPAFVGAAVGRWIIRRDQNKNRDDDWSVREDNDHDDAETTEVATR